MQRKLRATGARWRLRRHFGRTRQDIKPGRARVLRERYEALKAAKKGDQGRQVGSR